VGGCFPTEGDFAILELVEVKKRYLLVKINVVPYLVEAVHRYFKEAEGAAVLWMRGLSGTLPRGSGRCLSNTAST